jgi:hypothetical protein
MLDGAYHLLKTLDATEELRRDSNLIAEELNEMPRFSPPTRMCLVRKDAR